MTKVKNAQKFGAQIVIISDFPNEEVEQEVMSKFNDKIDGFLSSHIPAFEISYKDAKNMVEVIHDGES